MAASQFVIAGRADCEQYARLEAAADRLQAQLPSFRVYKEPQPAEQWPCYLRRTCAAQGWDLPAQLGGPLVWRVLVQRGGRGLLVGGLSEFLQLAAVYYGLPLPEPELAAARQMAAQTAQQLELERRQRRQERTAFERRLTSVAVIGALTGAAYHFLAALATGRVLGEDVTLRMQLLGDPRSPELAALRAELYDLASPQLGQVALLPTLREAVRNATIVIVLDRVPNRQPPPPTPPPSPPAEAAPAATAEPAAEPAPAPGDVEDERTAEAVASPAGGAASPAASPPPPLINITLDESAPAPQQLDTSSPPSSARWQSGESRRLSTIQEDPDSEAQEEEEMEQYMASRPGSGGRANHMLPGVEPVLPPPVSPKELAKAAAAAAAAAAPDESESKSQQEAEPEATAAPAAAPGSVEDSIPGPAASSQPDGEGREQFPGDTSGPEKESAGAAGEPGKSDAVAVPAPSAPDQPDPAVVPPAVAQPAAADAAAPPPEPQTAAGATTAAAPGEPTTDESPDGQTTDATESDASANADTERAPGAAAADDDEPDVPDEEVAALFDRMREYAVAIDATASSHCRVVVAGGRLPCFAATVALLHLSRLPPNNVIALCQPRVNQLRALIAAELGVAAHDVHGLVEWGNPPAGRSWLDLEAASVSRHAGAIRGPPGYRRPLLDVLFQSGTMRGRLPRLAARRAGSALLPDGAEVTPLALAISLAATLHQWWAGHEDGHVRSLGVASDGSFGVPERLVFAAPARMVAGDFRVCQAAPLSPEGAAEVRAAAAQMVEWLGRCGVRLSPSGRHCTISTCASSVYGDASDASGPSDGDGEPDSSSADARRSLSAEGQHGSASGERPPSDTDGEQEPDKASAGEQRRMSSDGEQGPDGERRRTSSAEGDKGSTTGERRLSSAEGEKGSATVERRLSSAEGEKGSATMERRLSSAEGDKGSTTGERRLSSAEGEKGSTTRERRLSSAEGEKGSVTGERRLSSAGGASSQPAAAANRDEASAGDDETEAGAGTSESSTS